MKLSKLYQEMSVEEQLTYVNDLTKFAEEKMPVLENLKDNWELSDIKEMARGLKLLSAFPFARGFAEQAMQYGDYKARTYRLRFYVDMIKDELSQGSAVKSADGKTYAFLPAMQQQVRRRGRPTREESLRQQMVGQQPLDAETKKQQAIANLLGIEIVTNQTIKDKSNEQLAEERAEREAEEAKKNPSLFGDHAGESAAAASKAPTVGIPATDDTRLHLDQLKWLMTKELADRVDAIRGLRAVAASNAERAKVLAEQGKNPEEIETYAQAAAEATESYEKIYDDVDRELATVYYRLRYDEPYCEKFKKRYNKADVSDLYPTLKPYWQKMPKEFEASVKLLIEQENPEFIAKQKEQAALKKEETDIIRYLRRKDKQASEARVKTAREKFARLEIIMGKDMAKAYKPLLKKIEDEFESLKKQSKK